MDFDEVALRSTHGQRIKSAFKSHPLRESVSNLILSKKTVITVRWNSRKTVQIVIVLFLPLRYIVTQLLETSPIVLFQ